MNDRIGFIGMGNMATALAKGMIAKNAIAPEQIIAYDINTSQLSHVCEESSIHSAKDLTSLVVGSDIIIIAIKPSIVDDTILPIKELLSGKVVISLAFGWNYEHYQAILDESTHFLYMVPNLPAQVGEGIFLLEEKHSLSTEEYKRITEVLSQVGMVQVLPSNIMAVGGVIASCAPAFINLVLEAIADGGVLHGIPRELAYQLVSQAMIGTGKLYIESNLHPGQVKDMVCSPGGATIKGIASLEEDGVRGAFIKAVDTVIKPK